MPISSNATVSPSRWRNSCKPAGRNVQHALKANWLYELPSARSNRWAAILAAPERAHRRLGNRWCPRIQTGEMLDFGNVRLVGMTADEFKDAVDFASVRTPAVHLPDDILQNTVKALPFSATSRTVQRPGAPTGRYLAPANGPDCLETTPGFGDCGVRALGERAAARPLRSRRRK